MKQIEIGEDIYEAALKMAAERNESVQKVLEQLLREMIVRKPHASSLIGAFRDQPKAVDLMLEYAMELRERPLRISHA